MKRILTILLAAMFALSLASCGGSSESKSQTGENNASGTGEGSSSTGTDFQKNMAQTFGGFSYPCESEDGYYFVGSNGYVYYADKENESTTILCAKPECSHDDEDCNAYAGSALTCYGGKLYYFSDSGSSWTQIYSMNPDGTDHTLVQTLDIDSAGDSFVGYAKPIIHRGMVYFLYSAVLYAVPLGADSSEAKAIYGETTEADIVGGSVISQAGEQESPYESLWGKENQSNRMLGCFASLFTMALLCGGMAAFEKKSHMHALVRATPRGRGKLWKRKIGVTGLLSLIVWGIHVTSEMCAFWGRYAADILGVEEGTGLAAGIRMLAQKYNQTGLCAPVQSLVMFAEFPLAVSVGGYYVVTVILRLGMLFIYSVAVLVLADRVANHFNKFL